MKIVKKISGLLPIRKQSGVISKDVERSIVSKFGKLKIGHIGTLDPMASGVLPLLFGDATKLQDYFDGRKEYRICIRLGTVTDTYDIEGKVVETYPYDKVSLEDIKEVIQKYKGSIVQIPPVYSAVKFKGKALYSYVTRGKEEELDMNQFRRQVHIYGIDINRIDLPYVDLRVECSKGTYMRTLAYDIGRVLGCGGCLSRIERTYSSGISLDRCIGIESVLQKDSIEQVEKDCMIPISSLSLALPEMIVDLDNSQMERLFNGVEICYPWEDFTRFNCKKDGLFLLKNQDKVGVVELVECSEDKEKFDTGSGNRNNGDFVVIKLRRGIC